MSNIGKNQMLNTSGLGTVTQLATSRDGSTTKSPEELRIASLQRRRAKGLDDIPKNRPRPRPARPRP